MVRGVGVVRCAWILTSTLLYEKSSHGPPQCPVLVPVPGLPGRRFLDPRKTVENPIRMRNAFTRDH